MTGTNRENALSPHAKVEDREKIEEFLDQMRLDDSVAVEDFRRIVRRLLAARGRFVYFIWSIKGQGAGRRLPGSGSVPAVGHF